jgi:hypothetical protein
LEEIGRLAAIIKAENTKKYRDSDPDIVSRHRTLDIPIHHYLDE